MTRDNIRKIQDTLNYLLPELPKLTTDGLWGSMSKSAGMAWQKRRGLDPTGDVEELYALLFPAATPPTTIRPIDSASLLKIQRLHPRIRQSVTDAVNEANAALTGRAQVRIVQGLRTMKEQADLYAQGRTKPGQVVTNAKPGSSLHNFGLAVDFALLIDGKEISWSTSMDFDGDKIADWMEVVAIFKRRGFTWGGDFKSLLDMPHFEQSFGLTWRVLLAKYNAGKVDSAGYVLL